MTKLLDRFVCRREGHVPTVTLTRITGVAVGSYFTTCRRCGRVFEQRVHDPVLEQNC